MDGKEAKAGWKGGLASLVFGGSTPLTGIPGRELHVNLWAWSKIRPSLLSTFFCVDYLVVIFFSVLFCVDCCTGLVLTQY